MEVADCFAPATIARMLRGEPIMTAAVRCMAFCNVWPRPFIQRSSEQGFLTLGMGAVFTGLWLATTEPPAE